MTGVMASDKIKYFLDLHHYTGSFVYIWVHQILYFIESNLSESHKVMPGRNNYFFGRM